MLFGNDQNKKKKRIDPEDDGRTIVNMNVDGMPWYVKGDEKRQMGRNASDHDQLTEEELRLYKFAALKSALIIALIFGVAFFIFIAVCDFIWFK